VGSFAVIPRFETRATVASAAADRVHVVVRRAGDEELAADVTTDLDASGEGEVSIRVDLREDPEVFLVMLEAVQSSDGAVLYVGSTEVSVSASGTASATVTLRVAGGVSDPAGDTFETEASEGLVPPDLLNFSAVVSGGSVTIQLDFAQPVAPATSQSPNVVVAVIDIDIDQSPVTGNQATADFYRTDGATTGMGVDYVISLFPDSVGRYAVFDVESVDVGSALAQFTGNSIIVTVPLSVLGGDDGAMDLSTTVGTIPEPTDYAPNVGSLRIGGAATQSAALGRRHPEGRASWGARR
jgi:hypothetical protein